MVLCLRVKQYGAQNTIFTAKCRDTFYPCFYPCSHPEALRIVRFAVREVLVIVFVVRRASATLHPSWTRPFRKRLYQKAKLILPRQLNNALNEFVVTSISKAWPSSVFLYLMSVCQLSLSQYDFFFSKLHRNAVLT